MNNWGVAFAPATPATSGATPISPVCLSSSTFYSRLTSDLGKAS